MHLSNEKNGWWIVMDSRGESEEYGPYETKAEASEGMRRLRRFLKFENEPGYVTADTKSSKDLE